MNNWRKSLILVLFIGIFCAFLLPVYQRIGNTSAFQGGTLGPAPVVESEYYSVDSTCIGYWAFWDGTKDDHSSYNQTTTLTGGTFVTNGLTFNGSSDKVIVTHSTSLNASNIIVVAWIKPVSWASYEPVMIKSTSWTDGWGVYYFDTTEGDVVFYPVSYGNLTTILTDVGTGSWVHFGAWYNGSQARAYRNLVQGSLHNYTGSIQNTTDLHIGEGTGGGGGYYDGTIGEILLFNTVASEEAALTIITNHRNATVSRYIP